jgi:hypothetical protein
VSEHAHADDGHEPVRGVAADGVRQQVAQLEPDDQEDDALEQELHRPPEDASVTRDAADWMLVRAAPRASAGDDDREHARAWTSPRRCRRRTGTTSDSVVSSTGSSICLRTIETTCASSQPTPAPATTAQQELAAASRSAASRRWRRSPSAA